jgi:hypothetical protein
MLFLKLLAILFAAAIATGGLIGMFAPSLLLEFGRSLQSATALYIVAAIRIVFGVLLLAVAPASRLPTTLRIIGVVIIIAGLLAPVFGVDRSHAMFEWISGQGLSFVQAWVSLAIVFGLFIIYAIASPGRPLA